MIREKSSAQRGTVATACLDKAIADCAAELWAETDTLRGSIDAAEYRIVVLGLIFLKYISDAFEERRVDVLAEFDEDSIADRVAYGPAHNIRVPSEARWAHLRVRANQPAVGQIVDRAMAAVERDNPELVDVLPKNYARLALDDQWLQRLIELIGNCSPSDGDFRAQDVAGRVYDCFLSQLARAEDKKGGGFQTASCVAKVLVGMLQPARGRIYDPCCGSAALLVQSVAFARDYFDTNGNSGRSKAGVSIHGQELHPWTWRLAKMNLAIRGIGGQIALGDSLLDDRHTDLKADFILAHPPFGLHWSGKYLARDQRWRYGIPPRHNANFAWIQHMVHHLAPGGVAGCVLPNGSMSSNQREEKEVRKNLIEADLVDCMVALPGQLFHFTQMPVCLWLLARRRRRRGEILFIDSRKLGQMVGRTRRELTDHDIARIAETYHAWRDGSPAFDAVAGFCRSVSFNEVRRHDHSLAPWRYVGAEPQSDDSEPFETRMHRLIAELHAQQAEAAQLDAAIVENLQALGFKTEAAETAQKGSLRAGFVSPTEPFNP